MHIALFLKVIYYIQILLKKNHILYYFSYKVTFSMSKVRFYWNKKVKHRFIYKRKSK